MVELLIATVILGLGITIGALAIRNASRTKADGVSEQIGAIGADLQQGAPNAPPPPLRPGRPDPQRESLRDLDFNAGFTRGAENAIGATFAGAYESVAYPSKIAWEAITTGKSATIEKTADDWFAAGGPPDTNKNMRAAFVNTVDKVMNGTLREKGEVLGGAAGAVAANVVIGAAAGAAVSTVESILAMPVTETGGAALATRTTTVERLERSAHPFTNSRDVPGGAGGVMSSGKTGKFLRTNDIHPQDLPYASSIRPAKPLQLASNLDELPRPRVTTVTDTVFASDQHSGSAGLVRLGELSDGRPVALKTYYPVREAITDARMLEEARSAQVFSDTGVGPKFHGVYRDTDGKLNIVTDIVPGDFTGTKVTGQTFSDLETIGKRLQDVGIEDVGDFQLYRTQDGRLLAIDPNGAAKSIGRKPQYSPDNRNHFMTRERLRQLQEADPRVGRPYVDNLRTTNPEAYQGLMRGIETRNPDWGQNLDQYLPAKR